MTIKKKNEYIICGERQKITYKDVDETLTIIIIKLLE